MHSISNCQICNGNNFSEFLICKDYTVSKEKFAVVSCDSCGFKFTNPIPDLTNLGSYYKSNNYISHSNTSKGIVNGLYQTVRKYTLVKKLQLINNITKIKGEKHLLDIGCGTGEFLNTCKNGGWQTQGIEPDTDAKSMAEKNYSLSIADESFFDKEATQLYNCITMWHVLEHVPHLNERLQAIHKLLSKNGKLIVAVPNCSSNDAAYYKEYWGAYDVPRHLHHFTPKDIELLMQNNGMVVERILPMVFDSFYVSLLSEKYKTGKNNIVSGFVRGLISNIKAAAKNNNTYSSQIYIIAKK